MTADATPALHCSKSVSLRFFMFSLIALYFAHRRLAAEAGQPVAMNARALAAANEQEALAILPLAA